jgi:hypothetical protein
MMALCKVMMFSFTLLIAGSDFLNLEAKAWTYLFWARLSHGSTS